MRRDQGGTWAPHAAHCLVLPVPAPPALSLSVHVHTLQLSLRRKVSQTHLISSVPPKTVHTKMKEERTSLVENETSESLGYP